MKSKSCTLACGSRRLLVDGFDESVFLLTALVHNVPLENLRFVQLGGSILLRLVRNRCSHIVLLIVCLFARTHRVFLGVRDVDLRLRGVNWSMPPL